MNARLRHLLGSFSRARVLVVGDLMLDRFIWGDVRRISPEAPVPVVHVARESTHPGGAGNVVANLAALGASPAVVGWVGRDESGRRLRRLLEQLGADTAGMVSANGTPSIEKTRIIAHSQQVVRLDREPTRPGERLARRLLAAVERALPNVDAVLLSDYGKGTIGASLLELLGRRRRREGFIYLIDPKPGNFDAYQGATLIKPNESEAVAAAGMEIMDGKSLHEVGRRLLERWQSDSILISRGEHGLALFQRGVRPQSFPAVAREVFDVTGAGDTVLAVTALTLAVGGTLEEAATLANLAAGVVVGKVGTATVEPRELRASLGRGAAEGHERRRGR
jgi:D-beta-D-heptose 7-phosphate kinase/D-beta-D-heptose 1-phosphate adenosyltransferase